MDFLKGFVILIFSNLIITALLQQVAQPERALFYIGLVIGDIIGLYVLIKGAANGE